MNILFHHHHNFPIFNCFQNEAAKTCFFNMIFFNFKKKEKKIEKRKKYIFFQLQIFISWEVARFSQTNVALKFIKGGWDFV
jgi:hypothetical protein